VVGFTKPPEGEEIAAFVVTSTDLTEAALISHCRARLDPDKRPDSSSFRTFRAMRMARSCAGSFAAGWSAATDGRQAPKRSD
jgi:hypothetical protein